MKKRKAPKYVAGKHSLVRRQGTRRLGWRTWREPAPVTVRKTGEEEK